MDDLLNLIEPARSIIAARISLVPRIALILGSGWSELADNLDNPVVVPYTDIPGFPPTTVVGHRGELVIGVLAGQPVAVMRGRFHFYEGHSMQQVTFPVRVLRALGCTTLLATNAAGGLHADWSVGDLMLITDHIFLPGLAGHHPLRGPNDERMGPRFPAMVGAYDRELMRLACAAADDLGILLREGVYLMLSGPAFESSAELRMCRLLGADAVGMSTVPEIVVARHMGMRCMGLSLITNLALADGPPANHQEVLDAGKSARPRVTALIRAILERMDRTATIPTSPDRP
ncbi:purine-nucleoside phosphorylase [Roseiflexus castenholzii]|uniref:Purine nucleoside phosphorylase n=1 Tax=Roseiflexus castenholzii (strain DSM 13941 / HLO8) TaxID=383372 RepID=A7NJS7_ROSCS|nr:purine-nucleoside phosphorylase [Roseiflexus castenholzii]ABU57747.1 inosine guanosine and xanthosine phosphorylase family [Roseiflexus castenholzii DSM 13941]